MAVRGDWGFAARDSEEQYVINHACKGRALAKLKRTDPQTNHIFANLCHCSDPADLPLELRGIAGPTEWTLLHWFSTVDRPVRCSTNVKRVMHVIIELAGICGVFLTGRQDFSCLLGYFRLGPKFQQASGKGGSCLEVLELEEKVEGCPQHQDHMHRLQV